jgi:SAM-dependent methyltransferase
VPFDHNDHYHYLLIRELPPDARTALDVGSGTGKFARRLARRGINVDAIEASPEALAAARKVSAHVWAPGTILWHRADVTEVDLPSEHYDFISCIASIHHMPFSVVKQLREALAPGGVLVILGLYREETTSDKLLNALAVPANLVARLVVALSERLQPNWETALTGDVEVPTTEPKMTLAEIKQAAAEELPGCKIRRLLFWRYLLVYRK